MFHLTFYIFERTNLDVTVLFTNLFKYKSSAVHVCLKGVREKLKLPFMKHA